MNWMGAEIPELWERLRTERRAVVLYGMGDGADKILRICSEKGISIREIFASDGFVRGQCFHGRQVISWSEVKARYGARNVVVLLAFATSLPEVLRQISKIASEADLYVPDVPVFGNGLFDEAFAELHRGELLSARELLSDTESRRIFDLVLRCKLSGELPALLEARSDPNEAMQGLIAPPTLKYTADLGAYNGDSVRELLSYGARPERIFAMEPDPRSFRKLSEYAAKETRTEVLPIYAAAWDCAETLVFDSSGGRGACAGQNRSDMLGPRNSKAAAVPAKSLDSVLDGRQVDLIKYDVEGSEHRALAGSAESIRRNLPTLLVSLYHRVEDLFALPLYIHAQFPHYRAFYLRRFGGVPAWELNLYVRKELSYGEADHSLLSGTRRSLSPAPPHQKKA